MAEPKVPVRDSSHSYMAKSSLNQPVEKKEKPTLTPIKGAVTIRKKSLGRKLADFFLGENLSSTKHYIFDDVLIPALKNALFDMIRGGSEMLIFGSTSGNRGRYPYDSRYSRASYVPSYARYYEERDRRDQAEQQKTRHRSDSADLGEVVFASRLEAEEVLNDLVLLIENFGSASMSDLNSKLGEVGTFTDDYWGWKNLSDARIIPTRDGFVLDLPKPISIK